MISREIVLTSQPKVLEIMWFHRRDPQTGVRTAKFMSTERER